MELANSFADILKVEVDKTKEQAKTDLLNNTKKPTSKETDAEKELTKSDFLAMSYADKKQLYFNNPEQYNEFIK